MSKYFKVVWKIILFLFIFQTRIYPFDTAITNAVSSGWIEVSAKAIDMNPDKILKSLNEGLKSEIFFQLRLYKKNKSSISIFGDLIVAEKKPFFVAYRDFFSNLYVIETSENKKNTFSETDIFMENFSRISSYRFYNIANLDTQEYYILARIIINPVKLEPPLHIISLFSSIGRTTRWAKSSIKVKKAAE